MGSFPCGLRDGCWKHKRWKWRVFLNHCTVYNLLEEVGFSLQSPHMHYFYEKEVIVASQRLALPTLADFLARPLLGKLNRFVLGLPILCDGNHACLREARFAQKSQESGKNTLFCVVKVVSLKKSGQRSTYTSHDHSHQFQRWTW